MNRRTAAYTLIELIVAIALLAAILGLFSMVAIEGNRQLAYAMQLQKAVSLAEFYMNEVIACGRWDERSYRLNTRFGYVPLSLASLGSEETAREQYDDCDDYNGFTATGTHTAKNGRPLDRGFSIFTVSIQVTFVNFGQSESSGTATDSKKVTVQVLWGNEQKTQLSTVLTNAE